MKYTFESGFNIEGSLEQILAVGKSLGVTVDVAKIEGFEETTVPAGYYLSAKDGLVPLNSMNPFHLRNALMKRTKAYLDSFKNKKELDNPTFLKQFVGLTEDKVIVSLFEELATR